MIVFNGFWKLVRRNFGILVLYLSIFLTICISVQFMTDGEGMEHFQEESLDIAVIDRDQGGLAKALAGYLGQRHHLVEIEDDPDVIQEELFYRNIYYVVTIPADFEEKCLEKGEKLPATKIPGAYSAYYVDQQISSFLNDVRVLKAAGYQGDELYGKAARLQDTGAEVILVDKNGHGGETAAYAYMFQYMPYIIFSVICYVMAYVMLDFRKKDVRLHMKCSAMPSRKQNGQLLLGYLIFGAAIWCICILSAIALYGKDFLGDGNMPLYLLNAFAAVLVSLAISFTISTLIERTEVISPIVNVMSLGMSFICGVFVSLDVLAKGVKMFARFLPFYWYETVNQILGANADFSRAQKLEIGQGLGIQALFALAIVCVGMMIDRNRAE